jgi:TolA-binding protein
MSLSNVKRTKEACVVLSQVSSKYKKSASAATLSRAEDARAQLKCS